MRILLVNPWITDFAAYDFWVKPLGLLYVGAFLRLRGHELRLVDCTDRFQDSAGIDSKRDMKRYNTGKFHREIIAKPPCLSHVPRYFCRYGIPVKSFRRKALNGPKPDAVLVTSVMTYWYHGVFEAIAHIRDLFPGVPVILGGIYATLCSEHAREMSGADIVVTESSPSKQVALIESLCGGGESGTPVSESFPDWPEPAWDLYGCLVTASVLTTRGCPMNCTVCASKLLFDGFERRDPAGAAAEIIRLSELGVRDIAFCDDALLIDTESHARPLLKALADVRTGVRLHTPNGLHVREITPEIAILMKRAGFVTIRLSLETASPDRAGDFSYKVSRDDFRRAVHALADAGFSPADLGAYVMAGLPGQTLDEVLDTVRFAQDTGIRVKPALFSPVPGTVEFQRAVAGGIAR
jgi:radical SAM superfamily enzyme YgiQ (UPF0313 family)